LTDELTLPVALEELLTALPPPEQAVIINATLTIHRCVAMIGALTNFLIVFGCIVMPVVAPDLHINSETPNCLRHGPDACQSQCTKLMI
jgi:hypothetical protein